MNKVEVKVKIDKNKLNREQYAMIAKQAFQGSHITSKEKHAIDFLHKTERIDEVKFERKICKCCGNKHSEKWLYKNLYYNSVTGYSYTQVTKELKVNLTILSCYSCGSWISEKEYIIEETLCDAI